MSKSSKLPPWLKKTKRPSSEMVKIEDTSTPKENSELSTESVKGPVTQFFKPIKFSNVSFFKAHVKQAEALLRDAKNVCDFDEYDVKFDQLIEDLRQFEEDLHNPPEGLEVDWYLRVTKMISALRQQCVALVRKKDELLKKKTESTKEETKPRQEPSLRSNKIARRRTSPQAATRKERSHPAAPKLSQNHESEFSRNGYGASHKKRPSATHLDDDELAHPKKRTHFSRENGHSTSYPHKYSQSNHSDGRSPSPARHRRPPSPARHRRSPSPARRPPSPARHRRSPSPVRRPHPPSRRSRSPVQQFPSSTRSPRPEQRYPSPTHRYPSPTMRYSSPERRFPQPEVRFPSLERRIPLPERFPSPARQSPSQARRYPTSRRSPSPARLPAHRSPSPSRRFPSRAQRIRSPPRRSPSPSRRYPMHTPSPPSRSFAAPRSPSPSRRYPVDRGQPSLSRRSPVFAVRLPSPGSVFRTRRSPSPLRSLVEWPPADGRGYSPRRSLSPLLPSLMHANRSPGRHYSHRSPSPRRSLRGSPSPSRRHHSHRRSPSPPRSSRPTRSPRRRLPAHARLSPPLRPPGSPAYDSRSAEEPPRSFRPMLELAPIDRVPRDIFNARRKPLATCYFCDRGHWSHLCVQVNTLEARQDFYLSHRLCFNCGKDHRGKMCNVTDNLCKWPNCAAVGEHHSALCPEAPYPITYEVVNDYLDYLTRGRKIYFPNTWAR